MYLQFEDNFVNGVPCVAKVVNMHPPLYDYHVKHPKKDFLMHTVTYDESTCSIQCTCKYFDEVGLLCKHCLRVLHLNNVTTIPKRYIVKRWTKDAMCTKVDDHVVEESGVVPSSVWRLNTLRNFNKLIIMSQNDMSARNIMEAAFTECQKRVELLVGSSENAKQTPENDGTQSLDDIYEDGNLLETGNIGDGGVDEANEDGPNGSEIEMDDIGGENDNELNIKDPIKKRKKGVRNIRLKSTQEKICNKLKGQKLKSWKKRTGTGIGKMKSKAQKSVKEYLDVPENSCVAHPTNPEAQLQFHGHDEYFGINVTPFGN
ncbi:protein FAR1-RELATED SEQUENCE 1-like [Beta vulgaris subsp. vulgaris]|uniref:protein FAR1-RELATED SEQUENCE 1-like n=1 Tax=Beta vulgaris subsp. vulgaris TaxID=3555 RepID=UPI0025465BEB|nr:protein FAR1-RELATED SEQUENCE 1-like [Beta vulgaris subsp. vulgaris]